ncbi:MAG: AAA family ATPase [Okeania sp. SIO2G4]|uniref:GumC family protein n=1 Tax=unclassified Okeania TaxID=2634635 RepID=UPI0013BD88B1|nr:MULTISPECIES: tyrosine-protein kinase domain-containing protein [unclassified Okeania]NEP75332.1 AAA family ATPase [Okeania sp. SIO2G5]NEP95366.1 AAA family ATPase [Okeania sp. SIO2F5]NEQ93052.1 AAA family ATPase [Okeania sp. SIO2G4]
MAIPIIKRYLMALGLYKWVGVATFTVAVGVSGIIALQPNPETKSTILGTLRKISPVLLFSETAAQIQQNAQAVTPEILLNDEVRQAVAEKVLVDPRKLKGATFVLQEEIFYLSYEDTDKEKAVEIVDALMEQIVEQSRKINTTSQRAIIDEVRKRLPAAVEELRKAQQQQQKFEREEEALLVTARAAALPGAIAGSRQQQTQIKLELDGVEAQIKSLEEQLGLTADQAYVARALAADPIIANLRVQLYQVENQLDKLLLDFTEEYPPVVELRRQKQVAEQQLQQRAAEVLGGNGIAAPLRKVEQIRVDASLDPTRQQLAEALIALKTQQEQLQRQLETTIQTEQELLAEYATIPNKQLKLTQLQEEVAIKKSRLDKMRATLEDAEAAEAEIISSLAIAEKAAVFKEGEPGGEKSMPLMLAIGGLAGIVVGGGLIFVLGMLSGKFYSWEEIQTALKEKDVPLLGLLPDVIFFDDMDAKEMPLLVEHNSPYLESYEKLRTNLQRQGTKPVKVLLLSSGEKGEGKTFCAYNLAIAAARAGRRTLLIETDLRTPSKVQSLKIVPEPQRTFEPLRYYSDISNCIKQVPEVENFYVIPSPGPVKQAGGIIESSEMKRLLSDSRHRFDFVILDSPCISKNNDALMLEPYTDGMIIVTRPNFTMSGVLTEVIEQLTGDDEEESDKYIPKLLGVVVNAADIPMEYPLEQFDDLDIPEPQLADSRRISSLNTGVGTLTQVRDR